MRLRQITAREEETPPNVSECFGTDHSSSGYGSDQGGCSLGKYARNILAIFSSPVQGGGARLELDLHHIFPSVASFSFSASVWDQANPASTANVKWVSLVRSTRMSSSRCTPPRQGPCNEVIGTPCFYGLFSTGSSAGNRDDSSIARKSRQFVSLSKSERETSSQEAPRSERMMNEAGKVLDRQ